MSAGLASTTREPERFVLQLATAADPATLEAWFDQAEGGHRVIYASGTDLPRETPGVKLVTRWVAAGVVETFSQRDPRDARRWQYFAEKKSSPRGSRGEASARPSSPRGGQAHRSSAMRTSAQAELLLGMLRKVAADGARCPSHGGVAKAIGLGTGERGKQAARYLFNRLQRQGAISWRWEGRVRVVTVLARGRAQGKTTAGADK